MTGRYLGSGIGLDFAVSVVAAKKQALNYYESLLFTSLAEREGFEPSMQR